MNRTIVLRFILIFCTLVLLLGPNVIAEQMITTNEIAELKQKAIELEKQEKYSEALKILESLTDQDYYIPPRFDIDIIIPGRIPAVRQLAMMRCHLALGNKKEAVDIAWIILEKDWDNDKMIIETIAEETEIQGGVESVRKKLESIINNSENQPMAKEALVYLNILDAGRRGDYELLCDVIMPWIKSAQWVINGHEWKQAKAISQINEKYLRHALDHLESGSIEQRETSAIILSVAPEGELELADPNLVRILGQYKIAINSTEDYREGNIAVHLLRSIATTRNSAYIESLYVIQGKDLPANKFPNNQIVYTLAYLGDESVIPQLQKDLEEGTYPHFVIPALRSLAGKPKASKEELLEWCRMKTKQQDAEGYTEKP